MLFKSSIYFIFLQQINKQSEDFNKLKEEKTEVDKKLAENDKKLTKAHHMLHSAKMRLQTMKETNDRLTSERLDMKKRISEQSSNTSLGMF